MNKRIISLLLAIVMILGIFPVTAMAEETDCDHSGAMRAIACNDDGTHTVSNTCGCGEVLEDETVLPCLDEDGDGLCDVCLTQIAEEASEELSDPADEQEEAALLNVDDNGTGDPDCDHILMEVEAKEPTANSVGWEAYVRCLKCGYNTYVEIPKLEEHYIDNYEEFLFYLMMLEELAWTYAMENPGKDPLALTLKYIRTGVERYNSGSWGIMAGNEDSDFAEFVIMMEEMLNEELVAEGEEPFVKVTGLKNLYSFELPNGEMCDIGHIFGMMDITYHNKFSIDHADVAGWGGDMIDLLEFADRSGVSGTLSEMVEAVSKNHLGITPPDGQVGFNQLDVNGDLDGFYFMDTMKDTEYEMYGLAMLMEAYYTEDLSEEDRAGYFLRNRLDGVSVRGDVRDAVYQAILRNNVVATLEGTRDFYSDDLDGLRKACCYAFADYLCRLAGDYVEEHENRYFEVFNTLSTDLAPGITQDIKYATTADGLQTVYYIATADITRDDVQMFANYNNNDPAGGWAMQRVEDQANAAQAKYGDPDSPFYIENYNVIASTNGAGFDMQSGEPGGVLVMGGVEYHAPNAKGFIGILDDGTAVIGSTAEYNSIYKGRVQEAIAVFGDTLVKDGKIVVGHDDGHVNKRASRTAAGITKTGKVVLMVMDGRQLPFSCGGSMQEIAQVMLEAGCVEAVNLDGGGSTTYVAKQPGEDAIRVINNPSDGVARSVSTSLMLVSTAPSSTAFDHAILETVADYVTIGTELQISPVGISATGNAAELPEGTTWAVSDERWGTVSEDGVFTGLRNGDVDVYLMLGEEIIGSKTIHVVIPNQVYFTKANVSAVYGQTVSLPVKALYDSKTVAVQPSDLVFSLSNAKAGDVTDLAFTAAEKTGIKNVQITVALAADASKTAVISVSLYEQGEATFDFEHATGGDRQLAWDRKVTNAVEESTGVYTVVDPTQDMETSYILAIDMTQIPIPAVLEDLTYMLPGSDIEGASAWTFLCQLAERVSALSEVRPTVSIDPNFDVDISGLKLVNDYFALTGAELDEETNTVTLTLNWIDQTHALDASMANPLCIVSGIKLTPKEDAQWNEKGRLNVVNAGKIAYKICLRASALYSFASKPENQATFQLFPFVDPNDTSEKGGYFESTYKTFSDSYTLVNQLKNGWYRELGGFTYYVDGEMLKGIQLIDGHYYDLGENGVSVDQSKYTGIVEIDGVKFYSSFGELTTGWQTVTEADGTQKHYYYDAEVGMYTGICKVNGFNYTFSEDGVLLRGEFVTYGENTKYYWAGGRPITRRWVHLEEGSYWVDHYGNVAFGYFPVQESTTTLVWHHFDEKTGVLIEVCDGFFKKDGGLYYCEDGEVFYGAIDTGDGLVFCGTMGKVVVNSSCYIGSDVDYTAGLEYGYYYCGKDGYIQKDGFAKVNGNTYYFTDYVRAKGFTKVGEDYYFFNAANGSMMTGTLWISGSNPYGMEGGYYTFQEDGKMYIPDPNGEKAIVKRGDALYFTVDGMDQKNGLNELDGEYYYATANGKLAVSTNVWISSFNDLIAPGSGWFAFDAEGKLIKTGFVTGGGLTYYYKDLIKAKGFTKVGEDYYFFNQGSGSMMTGTLWVAGNNAYGMEEGYYTFMADGKMYIPDPNGEKAIVERDGKLYFTIDGVDQKNGLNELDGEYYYATASGKLAVSTNMWISSFNDLIAPGAGWFAFDAEGKLVKTGFATGGGLTYYYKDLVKAKGFTKVGEDYYFFNQGSGSMMTGTLWVAGNNAYGVAEGYYTFMADGKMYIPDPNGEKAIVKRNGSLYFTIDGVDQKNGLNELDGEYYYATNTGKLAVSTNVWLSSFNDLIAPGNGWFAFDAEGKLVKTGFATGGGLTYYYKDLVRVKGFTKIGEDYYFFNQGSGSMMTGTLWISGSNAYGVAEGYYTFMEDGKMYIPDPNGTKAIVKRNGSLYFTVDGVDQKNGLNELDGEYYYANSNGKLAVSTNMWLSNFNDLIAPSAGWFAFDAEGKLVKTGFATGGGHTYYYKDLVRAKGLTKVGEDFYFFNKGSGSMMTGNLWIDSNAYGVSVGTHTFGADGKMVG